MLVPENQALRERKGGSSLLPTFLIIGAMKAGTTSLWRYLRHHPEIFMPNQKELHYFSERARRGEGLEWYLSKFEGADGARAIGEASPTYTAFPAFGDVPGRIGEVVPDVKLIYVLRHPIERMQSHYVNSLSHGRETRPIEEALVAGSHYLSLSRYAFQIHRFLPHFTRKQILIITSENLRDERQTTLRRIFEFLGVNPEWWSAEVNTEFNQSSSKGRGRLLGKTLDPLRRLRTYRSVASKAPGFVRTLNQRLMIQRFDPRETVIPDRLRRHLEDLVRDDVRDLRRFLGDDFDCWGLA